MIIHAYLTDGFFGYAKIFLESFKFVHGENILIVLSTRDLNDEQINELYSLYKNLKVENKYFNLKALSKTFGVTYEELLSYKNGVEKNHVNEKNKIWKQFTSADERIRSIYETMLKHMNEDYLIHFDIDMYIRKSLNKLFKLIKSNDISIRFRLKSKLNRKVMGGLIGFKMNDKVLKFMRRWIKYLDNVPIPNRKIGYGQTSFYLAYVDFKNDYKWGDIPMYYISPVMKQEDFIWSANTKAGKTKNLLVFKKDLAKLKTKG